MLPKHDATPAPAHTCSSPYPFQRSFGTIFLPPPPSPLDSLPSARLRSTRDDQPPPPAHLSAGSSLTGFPSTFSPHRLTPPAPCFATHPRLTPTGSILLRLRFTFQGAERLATVHRRQGKRHEGKDVKGNRRRQGHGRKRRKGAEGGHYSAVPLLSFGDGHGRRSPKWQRSRKGSEKAGLSGRIREKRDSQVGERASGKAGSGEGGDFRTEKGRIRESCPEKAGSRERRNNNTYR